MRIKRLYYATEDPKGGAISSGVRFFDQETCLHKPEVYYPFEEEKAQTILKDFAQKSYDNILPVKNRHS